MANPSMETVLGQVTAITARPALESAVEEGLDKSAALMVQDAIRRLNDALKMCADRGLRVELEVTANLRAGEMHVRRQYQAEVYRVVR